MFESSFKWACAAGLVLHTSSVVCGPGGGDLGAACLVYFQVDLNVVELLVQAKAIGMLVRVRMPTEQLCVRAI